MLQLRMELGIKSTSSGGHPEKPKDKSVLSFISLSADRIPLVNENHPWHTSNCKQSALNSAANVSQAIHRLLKYWWIKSVFSSQARHIMTSKCHHFCLLDHCVCGYVWTPAEPMSVTSSVCVWYIHLYKMRKSPVTDLSLNRWWQAFCLPLTPLPGTDGDTSAGVH